MTRRFATLLAALLLGLSWPASRVAAVPAREVWSLDQVVYPTTKDPRVLAELVKTHSLAAVIAVLRKHKIEFQRASRQVDTGLLSSKVLGQIAALPPGEPFIVPGDERTVASVIVGRAATSSMNPPTQPNDGN